MKLRVPSRSWSAAENADTTAALASEGVRPLRRPKSAIRSRNLSICRQGRQEGERVNFKNAFRGKKKEENQRWD